LKVRWIDRRDQHASLEGGASALIQTGVPILPMPCRRLERAEISAQAELLSFYVSNSIVRSILIAHGLDWGLNMFIKEPQNKRTVDHDRHVELRYVNSSPERPMTFSLTVDGTPIAFQAEDRDTVTADGRQALAWRVLSVGKGHLSFSGDVLHKFQATASPMPPNARRYAR
jgi:hypothetical protein